MIMEKIIIKNKKFTHDEEIVFGLNYLQELNLVIKFYGRILFFKISGVYEMVNYYKPHFFSKEKLKKKTGLDFYFEKPKVDDDKGIDNISVEEVRRYAKIAYFMNKTSNIVISYEYETGNWYFEDVEFDKTIDNDCKNVLSELVDKIIDICGKESVFFQTKNNNDL